MGLCGSKESRAESGKFGATAVGSSKPRPVGNKRMGNSSSFSAHLETAEKTGVLNLSATDLSKFPEKVLALASLRTLDLSKNSLKELPAALGSLEAMRMLNASANQIADLPPALFAGWKTCDTLNLSGNRLASIPDLGAMVKLKKLLVSNNMISAIPDSIASCCKLEILEAAGNRIGTVPVSIENCAVLKVSPRKEGGRARRGGHRRSRRQGGESVCVCVRVCGLQAT